MDGSNIHSADVPSLLGRIYYTRQNAANLLPNMRLDISPIENLAKYLQLSRSLTIFLYAFSIPLLLMILTFIGLVVDMSVGQRRNEIAVLRSRGSTTVQLVGMASLEALLLGLVGMLVGTPLAQVVAQFFGRARSFLDFSAVSKSESLGHHRIAALWPGGGGGHPGRHGPADDQRLRATP